MLVYLNNIIIYTGLEHTQVLRVPRSSVVITLNSVVLSRAPPPGRAPAPVPRPAAVPRHAAAQMYMQLAARVVWGVAQCGAARGPGCYRAGSLVVPPRPYTQPLASPYIHAPVASETNDNALYYLL